MYNASANSVKTHAWSVSRTGLKAILTVWKVKVQNNLEVHLNKLMFSSFKNKLNK